MSVVFVLTDKGWKDQDAVTTNNSLYCYDIATGSIELCPIDSIKDVSNEQTFYVYNRDMKYGTYCSESCDLALFNDHSLLPYTSPLKDVQTKYYEFDIFLPGRIKATSNTLENVKYDSTMRNRFTKDVKMRSVGMFHFDLDPNAALSFLDQWKTQYQRLNAVDYNQAMMLQLIMLKGGYFSKIEQEIGFVVKRYDREKVAITNIELSSQIEITSAFYKDGKQIHPICQIKDSVVIC